MKIAKTVKLFIGGKFVRSESERSYLLYKRKGNQEPLMRLCQASVKDFRDAVAAAKEGQVAWASMSAYKRGQILYRMAEMAEGKRQEFQYLFSEGLGMDLSQASKSVDQALDTLVYYAGFCDKYTQILGAINPINGPFHSTTVPKPMGVVALVDSDKFCFASLLDRICSILVGGNSVVALLGKGCPAVLAPLSEVFATSDIPSGTVNLLTGNLGELHEVMGGHHEVRAVSYQNENLECYHKIKELGAGNLKRVILPDHSAASLHKIAAFVEYQSMWHTVGA